MEHSTYSWTKREPEYRPRSLSFPHIDYLFKRNRIYTTFSWKKNYLRDVKMMNGGNLSFRDIAKDIFSDRVKRINYQSWMDYPKRMAREQFGIEFSEETPSSALRDVVVDGYYFSFPDFLPSGEGSIVDVGSQYGDYSVLCSKLFSPSKVIAFEPLPDVFAAFKKTVVINSIHNIEMHNCAVGRSEGVINIGRRGDMGVAEEVERKGDLFEVRTVTLDSTVIDPVEILKIDVEGFEVRVLEGANRLIEEYHPKIIVETHSIDLKKKVLSILSEYGYSVAHLGHKNYTNLKGMDVVQNIYLR